MVLQRNGVPLPPMALFVLRFQKAHSLTQGAYTELMDESDLAMLPWLRSFQVRRPAWLLFIACLRLCKVTVGKEEISL